MTNQMLEAVVTPTQIVVVDTDERVAYHELHGVEDMLPFYEEHKPFFRSLAQICRALLEDKDDIFVRITITEEESQND